MRDKRFVAVHRGGPLTRENHQKLIRWARECSEHVCALLEGDIDQRLVNALHVAREWENGKATVGDARHASVGAHTAARESSNPVAVAIARSIGHTVATAHMADHSIGGALYALKAMELAGKSTAAEREWQIQQLQQLPPEIVKLVLNTRKFIFT
ncbi:MAG: putative immunity protein [Bacteroidales bacterium]|jgi:hypothetical protein